MKYLWKVEYKDGTIQKVSEAVANMIRKALNDGDKFINTPTRTFSAWKIVDVEITSELDVEGATLLAAGKSVFSKGLPLEHRLETGEIAIEAIEIKKKVTNREYTSYYGKHHAYKTVESDGSGVWISFMRPAHLGIPSGCQLV